MSNSRFGSNVINPPMQTAASAPVSGRASATRRTASSAAIAAAQSGIMNAADLLKVTKKTGKYRRHKFAHGPQHRLIHRPRFSGHDIFNQLDGGRREYQQAGQDCPFARQRLHPMHPLWRILAASVMRVAAEAYLRHCSGLMKKMPPGNSVVQGQNSPDKRGHAWRRRKMFRALPCAKRGSQWLTCVIYRRSLPEPHVVLDRLHTIDAAGNLNCLVDARL